MNKIKVLVIDDSYVIRQIITEVLSDDEGIEVVGEAEDPYVAREKIKQLKPDVLTLDVEMPKMDGITFLRNVMKLHPLPVVMLSTLTSKGADVTLKALELGAVDFIEKPELKSIRKNEFGFAQRLKNKIKHAAKVNLQDFALNHALQQKQNQQVYPFTGQNSHHHLIAIGASTGGTEAIKHVVTQLPGNCPPIVITLHIPAGFSQRFAIRLDSLCELTVQEAKHGQKIVAGNVYIAPGDQHLKVVKKGHSLFCLLDNSETVNRHRPSVDVLFNSLVDIAGNVQAILLTGMGKDGAKALLNLKHIGARTIIQDKKSSLVWGMPGHAFSLGAHTLQLDLNSIAKEVLSFAELPKNQIKAIQDERR